MSVWDLPRQSYRSFEGERLSDQMIGRVAKNLKGDLGILIGWHKEKKCWTGFGFNRTSWGSKDPVVVADSIEDYIEQQVAKRMKERKPVGNVG